MAFRHSLHEKRAWICQCQGSPSSSRGLLADLRFPSSADFLGEFFTLTCALDPSSVYRFHLENLALTGYFFGVMDRSFLKIPLQEQKQFLGKESWNVLKFRIFLDSLHLQYIIAKSL